mgnify:CR=1 FL=1
MNPQNETVLIVDDDVFQLEIIHSNVVKLGFGRVLVATDGEKALEILRQSQDVTTLLLDVCMPQMDGPQLLRQLAAINCKSRIFLVSGVSNDQLISIGELGRSHGLNIVGYMRKPVGINVMKKMLENQAHSAQYRSGDSNLDISRERLSTALKLGEIHPWYQPKVDSKRLRVVGVEALARWRLPDGKMVSPYQFIPVIEAEGLSNELFFSIFAQVLADLRRWLDAGHKIKASVNLSMDCTFHLDLPDRICSAIQHHGVDKDQIVIEVTESRLMEDRASALETLNRITLAGLQLSIDDFGTGYSSLSQVAALPFSELKVDGSFVQKSLADNKAKAIVLSTVTLGRTLGMNVVAEGVEVFEQLDLLRECEASTIQGYLIARPMSGHDFVCWLNAWRPGTFDNPGCQRRFTLLVVDDSPSVLALIAAELAERIPQATILSAASGEQALEIAEQHMVDAATLDFHMPGVDGLELLQRLRNKCPSGRYVLLTADHTEDTAHKAVKMGALYCPKPLTSSQTERIVRYFMEP